jgi:signal transduction histidine kinase
MQAHFGGSSEQINPAVDLPAVAAPSRRPPYIWQALLATGPLFLIARAWLPGLDQPIIHDPLVHVLVTIVASILGVILALLVLHVARRAGDGRVFLIGMGFLSTAGIFITHSISTPNVLMSGRGLATVISASVSLWLGGVFFALSGFNLSPAVNTWLMRCARLWLAAFLVFWLAYNWVFLVTIPTIAAVPVAAPAPVLLDHEHEVHEQDEDYTGGSAAGEQDEYGQPESDNIQLFGLSSLELLHITLLIIGLGCYAFALARHSMFYRRIPSLAGRGMTYGMAFFASALCIEYFAQVYTFSFWLYHIQEFTGFAVIAYAVLGAYRRGLTDESLLESLMLSNTRAQFQAGYARAMDSLVETLSRSEQPTPALRHALRARFGLGESQVRVLEEAATTVAGERQQRQELETLNRALRQLEAHKDQLTQMIIHDLKNPLTALIGFLEILRMDHLTEHQRVLLENALRSGRNLSDLIGDLLDVGRIEEGRLELERSCVLPRELLVDCAHEMHGWLVQEGKTIEVQAPDNLPALCADLRLMRRVMLNLLSNAIKHTPGSTQIVLRATQHVIPPDAEQANLARQQIVIEVEDYGLGIRPEHLERIFEKFGRFSAEQPARQDSTGLGLTFCRLVVEAHGGTIGVTSVVGQGTTFRVSLPATETC